MRSEFAGLSVATSCLYCLIRSGLIPRKCYRVSLQADFHGWGPRLISCSTSREIWILMQSTFLDRSYLRIGSPQDIHVRGFRSIILWYRCTFPLFSHSTRNWVSENTNLLPTYLYLKCAVSCVAEPLHKWNTVVVSLVMFRNSNEHVRVLQIYLKFKSSLCNKI